MTTARILAAIGGALLAATSAWPSLAVDLKPKAFPLKILGVKVDVPVTISFDASTVEDALALQVRAEASLKDVQSNALNIARAILVPRGNCDHDGINPVVNSIDNASIAPAGTTAVVAIAGHVTAWLCEHPFGTTVKTIAASDSVTMTAAVQIIVVDQKQIGLQLAGPVTVTTGNALTAEAANLLGGDINASIASLLEKALDATEARASLPDLPGLKVMIQHAEFAGKGSELLVRASGTARMTSEAFNSLLELMNK
jgi:predicted DNA-binding ribbon-helix-helix protein